ncbi:MAG: hypothetical protein K6E55_06180 [Thermoguttaceae bacterium]|nr:hypothetical protein [Thermoguttaceae bacterium]
MSTLGLLIFFFLFATFFFRLANLAANTLATDLPAGFQYGGKPAPAAKGMFRLRPVSGTAETKSGIPDPKSGSVFDDQNDDQQDNPADNFSFPVRRRLFFDLFEAVLFKAVGVADPPLSLSANLAGTDFHSTHRLSLLGGSGLVGYAPTDRCSVLHAR